MSEPGRRRWVTLAEITALAGVAIAGVGQWSSWREGREASERAQATAVQAQGRFTVRGEATDAAILLHRDERHAIDGGTLRFPKWLGVAERRFDGTAIQRGWFAAALLKATDGGRDDRTGRLPVLLTLEFHDDSGGDPRARRVTGIHDLAWRTEGHALRGRSLHLTGFALRDRSGTAARLDRLPPPIG